MDIDESRNGKIIYNEGPLEVRENIIDFNSHHLYIGQNYFLLQAGCLEEFAQRTPIGEIEKALNLYDPRIPFVLKENNISTNSFQSFLLKARLEEVEAQLRDSTG